MSEDSSNFNQSDILLFNSVLRNKNYKLHLITIKRGNNMSKSSHNKSKYNFVDLFCGAGGLSLGFEKTDKFNCVFAIDTDENAYKTYKKNFPETTILKTKIEELSDNELIDLARNNKIHVVAGGPPCQAFSKAGIGKLRSLGMKNDPRIKLPLQLLRVVGLLKPEMVLIENVPAMRNHKITKILKTKLDKMGYKLSENILNSADFEVPQTRKRFFILAAREELTIEWPVPSKRKFTVKDAISDLPKISPGFREKEIAYRKPIDNSYIEMMRKNDTTLVYNHITRNHNDRDLELFKMITNTYMDIPKEKRPYRDDIFLDKYRRIKWNKPSPTILAHMSKDTLAYIHPDESQNRTLSVREAARLQSFPDDFIFPNFLTPAFRLVGNAVPPLLAKQLAEAIIDVLESNDIKSDEYNEYVSEKETAVI